jgi:carbonic anhydrase/acetyltransferase-like protein (isoleucine patch superfamily)
MKYHVEFRPNQVDSSAFIAPGAVVVGDVTLGPAVSVWFQAVLRGDTEPIRVGAGTNIQDGAILHTDPGYPTTLGAGVTVGHRAIVHGATVERGALIGMGATVLNGAIIGEECLVGANALVTGDQEFPARSLILGSPAKAVRSLRDEEIAMMQIGAETYVQRAKAFSAVYTAPKAGSVAPTTWKPGSIGDVSSQLGYDVRDLLMAGFSDADINGVLSGRYSLEDLFREGPGVGA